MPVITRCALDFRADLLLEVASVIDTGEAVDVSQLLRFLEIMCVLDGASADIGDRLERGNVLVREVIGLRALQHEDSELLAEEDQGHAHLGARLHEARRVLRHERDLILNDCLALFECANSHSSPDGKQGALCKDWS